MTSSLRWRTCTCHGVFGQRLHLCGLLQYWCGLNIWPWVKLAYPQCTSQSLITKIGSKMGGAPRQPQPYKVSVPRCGQHLGRTCLFFGEDDQLTYRLSKTLPKFNTVKVFESTCDKKVISQNVYNHDRTGKYIDSKGSRFPLTGILSRGHTGMAFLRVPHVYTVKQHPTTL